MLMILKWSRTYSKTLNKTNHIVCFVIHIVFVCRGMSLESCYGWSVLMKEVGQWVELEGHDYVMDLVCDLELSSDFPKQKSYFIISTHDPTRVRHNASMYVCICVCVCFVPSIKFCSYVSL